MWSAVACGVRAVLHCGRRTTSKRCGMSLDADRAGECASVAPRTHARRRRPEGSVRRAH
ncbi:hypothetical protein HYPSUDRAFT_1026367 [Hypholoma sublateritium FD-334 SS-4]|uniref:Uncharacterized protein n=1 Tax=Hypholoma sublateritium (strain FD-334 SS-4) TaxID=945553 RepID=A0A0D2PAE2_HYPSF|nr:hypothetical protein HYPSUDRAFT_1026367 [Hypholoma sublateritium FD-334 SS-4]